MPARPTTPRAPPLTTTFGRVPALCTLRVPSVPDDQGLRHPGSSQIRRHFRVPGSRYPPAFHESAMLSILDDFPPTIRSVKAQLWWRSTHIRPGAARMRTHPPRRGLGAARMTETAPGLGPARTGCHPLQVRVRSTRANTPWARPPQHRLTPASSPHPRGDVRALSCRR